MSLEIFNHEKVRNSKIDTINYGDYSIRMVINMVVMFQIVAYGFFEVQDIVTCFNDLCFKNFLNELIHLSKAVIYLLRPRNCGF